MRPRPALLAALGLNLALLLPALALLSSRPRAAPRGPRAASGPLHLEWQRDEPALDPTWPDQPRFTSDSAFRPVVVGSVVVTTSSRHDCVTAYESLTGVRRWRFVADGPVRFAPAVWVDRVYFVSDDGYLYCVEAETGELVWKFRGGPPERRILGNERLISTWPARGAPAVAEESSGEATVYFAAGIWPFMGVFLHALDARTGEPRWQNSAEGSIYIKQPHQTDAFAGIAPQGSLVVAGDQLLVPGGRSITACFDRHTGKRLHYRLADVSKLGGGPDVVAGGDVYFNGGGAFDLATGSFLGTTTEPVAVTGRTLFSVSTSTCRLFDLDARPAPEPEATPDSKAKDKDKKKKSKATEAWLGAPAATARVPSTRVLLAAHGRLYGAGPGVVYAIDLPLRKGKSAIAWQTSVEGNPLHLAVGDEQLFVSTREGRLYAFGPRRTPARRHRLETTPLPPAPPRVAEKVKRIVKSTGARQGYGVVWGATDHGLISELLAQTSLRLVIVDPERGAVAALREKLYRAGIDAKRAAVICAAPEEATLPPYFASLAVGQEHSSNYDLLYRSLRPHGGVACLTPSSEEREKLRVWAGGKPGGEQPKVEDRDGLVLVRRDGALPGAADWTHQHADAANTRVSGDARVKAPLGVLWFGGPGHQGILPRHGHGPVPQVCQGRLVIEGPDLLRAIDIYTGRFLWETAFPGLGKVYDNTSHQPGANAAGSNYVTAPEGVYVAYRNACQLLDPATGKMTRRYLLPAQPKQKAAPNWTFLTVADGAVVGGDGPVTPVLADPKKKPKVPPGPYGSNRLTVLDAKTGKVRFSITARHGFRHNTVCIGGGKLFAIDLPPMVESKKSKEKAKSRGPGRLVAHDLATGKLVWSSEREVFGTWLSYSTKHDVLVEAGLMSRDTLADEPAGMRAYRGEGGEVLWYKKDYFGPALIHGDRILKGGDARAGSGTACEVLTGKPIRVPDAITGELTDWKWVRNYGCNTPAASEHLVVFRSGAAGFYDLCGESGTGNLGGFRSSCTLNMIPAGGLLTVPDYTRTCTCSYQNQCSVGLVHMPDAELWTFTTSRPVTGAVRRLGLNLGAPGSRRAADGTLWLEHPPAGGPSPKLAVSSTPARPESFRLHASQVEGEGLKWVAASGVRGLSRVRIELGTARGNPRRYNVKLYFLEPEQLPTGARLFDVDVQGKRVLDRFDVREQAGGPNRTLVREIKDVLVHRDLTITLTPCADAAVQATVLSGVEVVLVE